LERLPKLSLPGGKARGNHNDHGQGQHKQSLPTTPRPLGTTAAVDSHPSRPIPLPRTHIPRTTSELQLREDMAVAEWREMCMFKRLVDGMKERQQAQKQHVTPCHQAAYRDPQDSPPHFSSRKQHPPTPITPQESPVFNDDSNRSAHLVDVLHRASELGDITGTETSMSTSISSISISAMANNGKQQQQAQQAANGWSLDGFAQSLSTTIPSFVNSNEEGEYEGIFTLDL